MKLKEKVDIPSPKVIERSYVKDPAEKIALQRLRTLELAQMLGNIALACRQAGMDRSSFFTWKRRYQLHGIEGLKDRPPAHKTHPLTTPAHVREAVVELSRQHPAWGCKRLSHELGRLGMPLSNFAVQSLLRRSGMGTRFERFLMLEQASLEGVELPVEQLRLLERLNPCFRERHVESSGPGELVSFDTFYVGVFKGIGRVCLYTAVDTFGSYAFGMLATARNSHRAAEFLYGQVMPFYEAHNLALKHVLTDNGTEFCGTSEHDFEAVLFLNDIRHRRTQVKHPQTNGFVERFHRTILDEFFRVEMRRQHFPDLESLELAIQRWLVYYNHERPHQGYRNLGKVPYDTLENMIQPASQEA